MAEACQMGEVIVYLSFLQLKKVPTWRQACLLEVVHIFLVSYPRVQSEEGIKSVNVKKNTSLESTFELMQVAIVKQKNDLRISNTFKMSRKLTVELKSEYSILGFVYLVYT